MTGRRRRPAPLLTATIMLALATVLNGLQVRDPDPTWVAPPKAVSKANPLAARLDVEPGGGKVFRERCATCHAEDGRGTSKGPDLTHEDVRSESDGALFWKISTGNTREGMPTFSFLSEAQRWQLVLHIRSLQRDPNR